MPFPKRQAAIVGVYTTKQGKLPERTSFSLQLEAIRGALDDAGLTTADVDGLLPMAMTDHVPGTTAHQFWAEQLGERPFGLVEIGGASGRRLRRLQLGPVPGLPQLPVGEPDLVPSLRR